MDIILGFKVYCSRCRRPFYPNPRQKICADCTIEAHNRDLRAAGYTGKGLKRLSAEFAENAWRHQNPLNRLEEEEALKPKS